MNTLALKKTVAYWQVKETLLVLAFSIITPFFIHLIPSNDTLPLGARLLPMFYAPVVAVVLLKPYTPFAISLLSPVLNYVITGHPVLEKVFPLSAELLIFSLCLYILQRMKKGMRYAAVWAYCITVLITQRLFIQTLFISLPGIAVLLLLNLILVKNKRSLTDGNGQP
ncbi:MAG: hypothetical protein V1727_04850 [Candidatus Omnitrophota bacterium]